jgi:RNA polymerase sigma-70 factor (ECF subfamily)
VLRPGVTSESDSFPKLSDAALVRAVLSSDPAARERFVARMRCVPRILAALNARHGRPLDDEALADLAQDAVVVVWRKLPEFRDPGPLEAWVYGIAYLEFRNAWRRAGRAKKRQVPLSEAVQPISEQESESVGDPANEIEVALSRLDPEDSSIIRLRHYEGLSFEAIGERLGIPMNTAKTRYHRSLRDLREWLRMRGNQEEHPR